MLFFFFLVLTAPVLYLCDHVRCSSCSRDRVKYLTFDDDGSAYHDDSSPILTSIPQLQRTILYWDRNFSANPGEDYDDKSGLPSKYKRASAETIHKKIRESRKANKATPKDKTFKAKSASKKTKVDENVTDNHFDPLLPFVEDILTVPPSPPVDAQKLQSPQSTLFFPVPSPLSLYTPITIPPFPEMDSNFEYSFVLLAPFNIKKGVPLASNHSIHQNLLENESECIYKYAETIKEEKFYILSVWFSITVGFFLRVSAPIYLYEFTFDSENVTLLSRFSLSKEVSLNIDHTSLNQMNNNTFTVIHPSLLQTPSSPLLTLKAFLFDSELNYQGFPLITNNFFESILSMSKYIDLGEVFIITTADEMLYKRTAYTKIDGYFEAVPDSVIYIGKVDFLKLIK